MVDDLWEKLMVRSARESWRALIVAAAVISGCQTMEPQGPSCVASRASAAGYSMGGVLAAGTSHKVDVSAASDPFLGIDVAQVAPVAPTTLSPALPAPFTAPSQLASQVIPAASRVPVAAPSAPVAQELIKLTVTPAPTAATPDSIKPIPADVLNDARNRLEDAFLDMSFGPKKGPADR
jgi:hypothetical protein